MSMIMKWENKFNSQLLIVVCFTQVSTVLPNMCIWVDFKSPARACKMFCKRQSNVSWLLA